MKGKSVAFALLGLGVVVAGSAVARKLEHESELAHSAPEKTHRQERGKYQKRQYPAGTSMATLLIESAQKKRDRKAVKRWRDAFKSGQAVNHGI